MKKAANSFDPNDPVYRCAVQYQKLIDDNVKYDILYFYQGELKNISLSFAPEHFKHLTGLHKLKDLKPIKKSSDTLLSKVLNNQFNFKDAEQSIYFVEVVSDPNDTELISRDDLTNRLSSLENLHSTIQQSYDRGHEVKLFPWQKNVQPYERPHNSKINADHLFEFSITQDPIPQVAFFIIQDNFKSEEECGVSIFKPDKKYSEYEINGKTQALPSLEILSFVETSKSLPAPLILKQCSPDELAEYQEKQAKYQQHIEFLKQKNVITNNRIGLIKAYDTGKEHKIAKATNNCQKPFIAYSENLQKFTNEYLEFLISSLKSQSENPHNQTEKQFIDSEIKMTEYVKNSRELIVPREQFALTENPDCDESLKYIDIQDKFIKSIEPEYAELVKTMLEKQKNFYTNPRNPEYAGKREQFSDEEIRKILQAIDEEIKDIEKHIGRGTGMGAGNDKPLDTDKPQNSTQSNLKKISLSLKAKISNMVSNTRNFISAKISELKSQKAPSVNAQKADRGKELVVYNLVSEPNNLFIRPTEEADIYRNYSYSVSQIVTAVGLTSWQQENKAPDIPREISPAPERKEEAKPVPKKSEKKISKPYKKQLEYGDC